MPYEECRPLRFTGSGRSFAACAGHVFQAPANNERGELACIEILQFGLPGTRVAENGGELILVRRTGCIQVFHEGIQRQQVTVGRSARRRVDVAPQPPRLGQQPRGGDALRFT